MQENVEFVEIYVSDDLHKDYYELFFGVIQFNIDNHTLKRSTEVR